VRKNAIHLTRPSATKEKRGRKLFLEGGEYKKQGNISFCKRGRTWEKEVEEILTLADADDRDH